MLTRNRCHFPLSVRATWYVTHGDWRTCNISQDLALISTHFRLACIFRSTVRSKSSMILVISTSTRCRCWSIVTLIFSMIFIVFIRKLEPASWVLHRSSCWPQTKMWSNSTHASFWHIDFDSSESCEPRLNSDQQSIWIESRNEIIFFLALEGRLTQFNLIDPLLIVRRISLTF